MNGRNKVDFFVCGVVYKRRPSTHRYRFGFPIITTVLSVYRIRRRIQIPMRFVVPFEYTHTSHVAVIPNTVCLRRPRLLVQGNTWQDVAQFVAMFTTQKIECGYVVIGSFVSCTLVREGMFFMDRTAVEECAQVAECGVVRCKATLAVPWPLYALSGVERGYDEYICSKGVYLTQKTPWLRPLSLPAGMKLFLCDIAAFDKADSTVVDDIPKALQWAEDFRGADGKISGIQSMHHPADAVYLAPTELEMPVQRREKYGVVACCDCSVCVAGFALRSSDGCVPYAVFVCFDDGSHLWLEVATENLAVLDPSVVVVRLQDHVHLSVFPMAIGAHYGRRSSCSRTLSVSLLQVHGTHPYGGKLPCFRAGLREDPGVVLTKAARHLRKPLPFSWMRLAWLQALC
jgi:hypothetical protein